VPVPQTDSKHVLELGATGDEVEVAESTTTS
jgi:hypothetical protein